MLDAKQVRQGNLVSLRSGTIGEVQEIRTNAAKCRYVRQDTEEISFAMVQYADLEGVPLNEKWLIKVKLKPQDLGCYWLSDNVIINVDGHVYCESEYTERAVWIAECTYVHQLQNLYYALTGRELEVTNG